MIHRGRHNDHSDDRDYGNGDVYDDDDDDDQFLKSIGCDRLLIRAALDKSV